MYRWLTGSDTGVSDKNMENCRRKNCFYVECNPFLIHHRLKICKFYQYFCISSLGSKSQISQSFVNYFRKCLCHQNFFFVFFYCQASSKKTWSIKLFRGSQGNTIKLFLKIRLFLGIQKIFLESNTLCLPLPKAEVVLPIDSFFSSSRP